LTHLYQRDSDYCVFNKKAVLSHLGHAMLEMVQIFVVGSGRHVVWNRVCTCHWSSFRVVFQ